MNFNIEYASLNISLDIMENLPDLIKEKEAKRKIADCKPLTKWQLGVLRK